MAKRRRQRPKSQRQYLVQNDALVIAAKLKGVRTEKLPRFIAPSLATLTDKVPNGAQSIHEQSSMATGCNCVGMKTIFNSSREEVTIGPGALTTS